VSKTGRYVYREINGKLTLVKVSARPPLEGVPPEATRGFHENVLNAYKTLEENGKWQGAYASPAEVKRIHETAMREAEITR
jgi:hypothetical protein